MKRNTSFFSVIDKKVFWSMALCVAISLSVLAFRFKHAVACATAEISVRQGPLYVGEVIQFRALGEAGESNVHWMIGDAKKNGIVVNHTFNSPGRYEVLLNTGPNCMGYMTVYVTEAPAVVDETLKAVFTGPLTVEVGSPAVFKDETPDALSWEWRFGENNGVDATEKSPTYTFKSEGQKTVILVVNGKWKGETQVLVTPKNRNRRAPIPKPISGKTQEPRPIIMDQQNPTTAVEDHSGQLRDVEPKFPDVSLEQLELVLKGIVDGENEIANIYAHSCTGKEMQVTYNGDVITLIQLQRELWSIKSKKKIRSIRITLDKDPNRNCINNMNITLKKKLL